MYCPICSQQQVSEEMRFCSRCGFPLDGLKELVAAGGVLAKPDLDSLTNKHSKLVCALRKSIWLMGGAFGLLLFVVILAALEEDLAVLILLPVLLFLLVFGRFIYTTSKESRRRKIEAEAAALAQNSTRTTQLPPQRVAPIETFNGRSVQTGEVIRPPSVTENTTRLLDET